MKQQRLLGQEKAILIAILNKFVRYCVYKIKKDANQSMDLVSSFRILHTSRTSFYRRSGKMWILFLHIKVIALIKAKSNVFL